MQRNHRTLFIAAIGLAMVTGMGCERLKSIGDNSAAMTTLNAEPQEVVDAAAQAVEDHPGLVLVSQQANELGGMVIARTVEDNPFRVQVNRQSRGISNVTINAGDPGLAYDVMEEIRSSLGMDGGQGTEDDDQNTENEGDEDNSPSPEDE